jgi:hypothetical protein
VQATESQPTFRKETSLQSSLSMNKPSRKSECNASSNPLAGSLVLSRKSEENVCHLHDPAVEVEVEVKLRSTVSRTRNWDPRRIFLSPWNFFRQFRVCYFVAPSLTRGRVCNLLYNCFWALPEQSLLGRSPAELTALFYCLMRPPSNLEGQVPRFISPRNRVAQLYSRALVSLCVASNDSQDYGGGILTRVAAPFRNRPNQ